ncbi:MAG: lipoate--protein ligase family protein [Acidobacteria bacterium]|nr:lipoate--protein ligase family protein [Acidobacteriota bacterium]
MKPTWRLIVDGALPGAVNMARDAFLLERAGEPGEPFTVLRLYRWAVPTLSLGNKQVAERTADIAFCRERGIDVCRRPTGGGAVLHHLELTYAVVSSYRECFQPGILGTYLSLSRALQRGLALLGVPAEVEEKDPRAALRPDNFVKSPVPCFTSTSHYEITVAGKKILGSAQKRTKTAFLQHGSIPYAYDWALQAGAMRADAGVMQGVMACIGDWAPEFRALSPCVASPEIGRLETAFRQAFAEVFAVDLVPEPLNRDELARAATLETHYRVELPSAGQNHG